VRVRDDKLYAPKAAPGETAQEVGPEHLGLRSADRHTEHFAPTVAVHTDRDGDGDRDDTPRLPHLQVGGVDPDIGPIAFDGTIQERFHPIVDLLAEPAHLALRDTAHPSAGLPTMLCIAGTF
jgi:hypothetical protein